MSRSLIPKEITISQIYFLRKRTDLSLRIIKITEKINEDIFYGIINFKYWEEIHRMHLLVFDVDSIFFKWLMRSGVCKTENDFRKALTRLGCKSDDLQNKFNRKINILDNDISLENFESEYVRYCMTDGQYQIDGVKKFGSYTVPGTKAVNAYNLYKIVCNNGGMEAVTNDQKWKSLFYQSGRKTNISYTVRTFYKKYLLEFEYFRRNAEIESDYIFNVGETISFIADNDERYFGRVKIRRNRGMNQYYIQFAGWEKEYSEWYCEDILEKSKISEISKEMIKATPKSSKNNYLVNDPLIREKHSHFNLGKIAYESVEDKSINPVPIFSFKKRKMIIEEEDNKLESLLIAIDYQNEKSKTINHENYIIKNFIPEPPMEKNEELQKKEEILDGEEEYLNSTLKLKSLTKEEKDEVRKFLKPLGIKGKEPKMTEYNYFFLNYFQ
ncbi:ARID/BRIGHT DNA binding domain protein [Spraguea lophii 42_110]|uniref:ARID/BRIGHT DNA binding domain protein n=1 Tax=Spraguea lophii (strain 42_110) TaxID=1358809 RepID=S7XI18_SPRLO|nr:ARID/BRIGHT DNA binding domain protein [Spraguea lophii 42_110]